MAARDFSRADLVISVQQKKVGGFLLEGNGILQFVLSNDEWESLVLPLITGTWHVPGVDNLDWFYYWKPFSDGDGLDFPAHYITEQTDLTGDIPNNYNRTPNNGGPAAIEATKVYNGLKSKLEESFQQWRDDAAEQAANIVAESQFVGDTNVPANMATLKSFRNQKLIDSDWTQLPDSPLTAEKKTEWATYRQALRDLPGQQADPYNPDNFTGWPTKPE